jgi:PadR family transcriptional regulator, regulatory protein PadR
LLQAPRSVPLVLFVGLDRCLTLSYARTTGIRDIYIDKWRVTRMRELKKGSLGMLLLQLLHERPSYGYELCERLRTQTDGTLSFDEGAMYPLLHEYERRGLVMGYWESSGEQPPLGGNAETGGAPESPRKGPRRRYYRITDHGVAALQTSVAQWQTFAQAVGRVLGGEGGVLDPGLSG